MQPLKFTALMLSACLMTCVCRAGDIECAGSIVLTSSTDRIPTSGKDTRRYPPDPQVDFQHLKLDLRMPEPMTRSFDCIETITFRTLGKPIEMLVLDAVDLQIKRVTDLSGGDLNCVND